MLRGIHQSLLFCIWVSNYCTNICWKDYLFFIELPLLKINWLQMCGLILEFLVCCVHAKSIQSCPTLCYPMECSPPGCSLHRILQARILEWVVICSSRESSQPRDQIWVSFVSCIGRWLLYHWGHLERPILYSTDLFICTQVPSCLITFSCTISLENRWYCFSDFPMILESACKFL